MRQTRNRLRSALFVLSALGLTMAAMAADRPATPAPRAASTTAESCTPWRFDGCCAGSEVRQARTCTVSGGPTFTETRCVVLECVQAAPIAAETE